LTRQVIRVEYTNAGEWKWTIEYSKILQRLVPVSCGHGVEEKMRGNTVEQCKWGEDGNNPPSQTVLVTKNKTRENRKWGGEEVYGNARGMRHEKSRCIWEVRGWWVSLAHGDEGIDPWPCRA